MAGYPRLVGAITFLLTLASGLPAVDPPLADRSAWEAVDIVPMPKRIRLTGRRLPLSGAVLVLGAEPSDQDRIGAKWIQDRIAERGGGTVPAVSETSVPDGATLRVFVGTRETCRAIEQGARDNRYRLGPGTPGDRGYVVEPVAREGSTDALLGGADPVGALYACVTFAGLLDGRGEEIVFREAEIVDWPDYETVTLSWNLMHPEIGDLGNRLRYAQEISPDLRAAYLDSMERHLDRLLAWKVSCFKAADLQNWDRLSPAFKELYKEVTAYGRQRGIRSLVYALKPFCGLQSDFPDAPKRCLTGTGRERYRPYLRCWSMDEERRITAGRVAEFVRDTGLTDVGFHDTDTGAFLNPTRWNERCEVCRDRWGDDYAAAVVHKHRIYYEEIEKLNPEIRIHFTLYPYNIGILTQDSAEAYLIDRFGPSPGVPDSARQLRERYTQWWRDVAAGLADDVTFCIRESVPANVRRFQELVAPHGTFIWYLCGTKQWQNFFDETPRWAPTFYSGRGDVFFNVCMQFFLPVKALAAREYAWNVAAPGAAGFARAPAAEQWRHAEPGGDLYEVVLPHVCRNLFGRRAAPAIAAALSLNVAYNQIFWHVPVFGGRMFAALTTSEKMLWQAEQAARGCEILDPLFARVAADPDRLGMTPYALRRFMYLREVYHCCRWMALSKAQDLLARELAKEGKLTEAAEAIARGREIVAQARAAMDALVAERIEDPIYDIALARGRRPPRWKIYTPGNRVDFGVPETELAQTEKELAALAASGTMSPATHRALTRRRGLHVPARVGELAIDGRVDEPEWQRAFPAEAFFVYRTDRIALADTKVHLLRDDEALYVGAVCRLPGGASIRSEPRERDGEVMNDELFELFLSPPGPRGGHFHFLVNADGSFLDERTTVSKGPGDIVARNRDAAWNAEGVTVRTNRGDGRWDLEMRIPLAALGVSSWAGTWRANLCRDFKGGGTVRELSSIQGPGAKDFHDHGFFPSLLFAKEAATEPEVEIAPIDFEARPRTLDDRMATICAFGLEFASGRILRDVRVRAECFGPDGRLHSRGELFEADRIVFRFRPEEVFEVGFEQVVEAGGVRIVLESSETRAERWIRIGGWQGQGDLAPAFSEDGALLSPCRLPSQVSVEGAARPVMLVGERRGTIEFRFLPLRDSLPEVLRRLEPHSSRRALFHFGTLRREHPYNYNTSSVVVLHDATLGRIDFTITAKGYKGWTVSTPFSGEAKWVHVACVWDLDAAPEDRLRLYLDGERVAEKTRALNPERIQPETTVDVTPYAIQVGCLNTGRLPARAAIRDLRLSRTARYAADFPPPRESRVDDDTTVAFPFRNSLEGQIVTAEGTRAPLKAEIGVTEYR